MSENNATQAGHSVLHGLLTLFADALRQWPQHEAVSALNGVEAGTHALAFGVTVTGAMTVITGELKDLSSSAAVTLPTVHLFPLAGGRAH